MIAEKHTIMVENYTGAEMKVGDHVCFVTGASGDGKKVEVPSATNLSAYAGCVTEAIGTSKGGLIQSKGWVNQSQYLSTTSLNVGDKLKTVATKSYVIQSAAPDGLPAFACYGSTGTVTAGSTALNKMILFGY
jgi:hypothetical protein